MKRKKNLYSQIYQIENILSAYNEVCKNTKNKRRVANLKEYKSIYISRIYDILINKKYTVGPYNKFIIYEPKKREIVSQNVQDKIINHLVARYILYPAILPCLLDINVASRKNMGTSRGLKLAMDFHRACKIKYYVRYQDDFLLFHPSKQYLKYCLKELENFLKKEKLNLNNKTRIYKNTNNFLFLGRDTKCKYARYRNVKRKIKHRYYLYKNDAITLNSFISSIICYSGLCKRNNLLKNTQKK